MLSLLFNAVVLKPVLCRRRRRAALRGQQPNPVRDEKIF